MILGFKYSVFHNGTYLMSIKDKYEAETAAYKEATHLADLQIFDLGTWWYKTTMFNLDYVKSEVSDSFNDRFGEFLVWCEIVPYAK